MYVGDNPPPAVVDFMANQTSVVTEKPINLAVSPPIAVHSDEKKKLQQALKDKGFYNGPVDGNIGPKTQEAIKAFKVANKLSADSIVGPKVKELLGLKD
jgi:peptidoglycan hydrolase-like protein with peptidoglycan-binding domain